MGDDHQKVAGTMGIFYGLGIGPGDPELLTIKAKKILQRVDQIFVPRSAQKSDSLAMRIISEYIKEKRVEEIIFPMTKKKEHLQDFWQQSANTIYGQLSAGSDVAYVTPGDPFIFSTYGYLVKYLADLDQRIEIVTIPGISAFNAASAMGNIPLTMGDEKMAVISLPQNLQELKIIFSLFQTVVIMKIGNGLSSLVEFLKKEGLDHSLFFIRKIGYPEQFITKNISSLDLNDTKTGHLSVMIIKTKN